MLDEKRVCIDPEQPNQIKSFEKFGFEVVKINLKWFNSFGGGFHCATCDVRRTGDLKS